MTRPAPVVWTKGTFLNPQHLQAQDRYLETVLQFKTDALIFRPWGFSRLALDRHQLSAGTVQISECAGIFADGLPFDVPAADLPPPPRDTKAYFTGDRTSALAFLSIPAYRSGGVNVAGSSGTTDARYRTEFEMLRDENTGLSEQPVPVARKNLRIL